MCRGAHHVLADHQAEAKQEASASRLEGGPQEGKNVLPLGASGGLRAARAHNGMARALTRAHDALCFAQEGLRIAGSTARHTSSSVSYFSSMGGVCGEVSVSLLSWRLSARFVGRSVIFSERLRSCVRRERLVIERILGY